MKDYLPKIGRWTPGLLFCITLWVQSAAACVDVVCKSLDSELNAYLPGIGGLTRQFTVWYSMVNIEHIMLV